MVAYNRWFHLLVKGLERYSASSDARSEETQCDFDCQAHLE